MEKNTNQQELGEIAKMNQQLEFLKKIKMEYKSSCEKEKLKLRES